MPTAQSIQTTRRGEFRRIYRDLIRHPELRSRTPVVFCEGDSWFSTPLAMNILDWLVFPTKEAERQGVPIVGKGGLFFRAENSGDMAVDIFAPKRLKDIMRWYRGFDFDIALLSAGGNDFVGNFLKKTFLGQHKEMRPDDAYQLVVHRFEDVHKAYERALLEMVDVRPATKILAHSYCYPLKLGVPAKLTLANLGAAAIVKTRTGPWIEPHIRICLPNVVDQREFARLLINGFVQNVLDPLRADPRLSNNFDYLDLRDLAREEEDWFDEMHPTGAGFNRLAARFAEKMDTLFDPSGSSCNTSVVGKASASALQADVRQAATCVPGQGTVDV